MADNIVVTYKENLDELNAKLKTARDNNAALGKSVSDVGEKAKSAGQQASQALKDTAKQTDTVGNLFDKLGAKIAAAFSVVAIIEFGKTSIKAFAEAELSVRKLNVAIGAGGGTSGQFQTLINQAKELQKTTIFSDEQIQAAQTLALQFGLTATEVQKLIPIITDFASATGQDLQSALEAVLRGSEGVARGLKVYGIEVSSTGTKTERLAEITGQLTQKFGDQASEVGKTTTGSFQKLKNAFNDLEESIGALLAKGGGFIDFLGEVTQGLSRFFKSNAQAAEEFNIGLTEDAKKAALKNLDELRAKLIASGRDGNDAFRILINESETIIAEERKKMNATWDTQIQEQSEKAIKLEKARIEALKAVLADETKARERTIKEGQEAAAKAAKDARDALQKDAKETRDAQDSLRKQAFDELNKNADQEAANRKLTATETIDDENKLQQAILQIDEDTLRQKIQNAKDTFEDSSDLEIKLTEVLQKQAELRKKILHDVGKEIHPNREDFDKSNKEAEDANKKLEEIFKQNFEAIANSASELLSRLQSLFSAQDENAIASINNQKDAELSAIDEQLAALDEAHNKRKIGDKKYEESKKKLLEQRKADEKKAADETKKLKIQEAQREKEFSIFSIILSTARAIIAALGTIPPNPALAVIAGITGAAELAIAVATPIPAFAKGTKGKRKSGMGLIGEQGAELVYMPDGTQVVPADRTRKYKEVVNSLIDNNFEQYVYKAMIAPAIREATRKMERDRQKSFAENIANYFKVNNETNPYRVYDGVRMNNKELANAIGKVIAKNIYQGYKNPYYR